MDSHAQEVHSDSELVAIQFDLRVPLRDGVCLSGTLYRRKDMNQAGPCIVAMTPYGSDNLHGLACYMAARGWGFMAVDVRGRGNSEGIFRPRIQEARDGHDVVEWVAAQVYCDGQVAMFGSSYLGYAQWATAKEFPLHLSTIVPTAAPYIGVDVPMRNNIFNPFYVRWSAYTSGRSIQAKLFADEAFWSAAFHKWHRSGLSFRELDRVAGFPSTQFQEYLSHPEPDAYWDQFNPRNEDYQRIVQPVLTITGAYDDDQPGALEHYRRHVDSSPNAISHYLVIGPWDHAGTAWPTREFGGLELNANAVIDIRRLHHEWYAWTMRGGPKPDFLKERVVYYMMGANEWRYADSLPNVTGGFLELYPDSDSKLWGVFSSGVLVGESPGNAGVDSYRYDPSIEGPETEYEAQADGSSLIDQGIAIALYDRALVYHSASFENTVEFAGFPVCEFWISIDCPDTDFYVSLYDVAQDGGAIQLSTDVLRARYRNGLKLPELVNSREPLKYVFDKFTFFARSIQKGHRVRLVLAPTGRSIQGVFAQRNFNAGGTVAEESAAEGRAVTVGLFHGVDMPSVVRLPLAAVPK